MTFFSRALVVGLLLCLVAPGACAGAAPPAAAAQGGPRFSIYPAGDHDQAWFAVTAAAGSSVALVAGIRNAGDAPVALATYATIATNPPNGGFAAGAAGDARTGAARWLDYPAATLTLPPGDAREIPFAVAVPAGTPPGEYVAALVVQTAEAQAIPGTETFRQIVRSAVSVEITVPGAASAGLALGAPAVTTGAPWTLDVPLANTGTARLRPRGELVVTTPDGTIVSTTQVAMGSVYGGGITSVRVALPAHLPPGDYRVSLALTDAATGARASLADAPITLAEPARVVAEQPTVAIDTAAVTPSGDPIRYAEIAATISNHGPAIPTATVRLAVQRDGEEVERYPLAEGKALPQGTTDVSQRYIPVDGWQPGSYTFALVISAVSGSTDTVLATGAIPGAIVVP